MQTEGRAKKSVLAPAAARAVATGIFPSSFSNRPHIVPRLVESVLAASAQGEEGAFLRSSILVLPSFRALSKWTDRVNVARVFTERAFGDLGLEGALRRHAPLLRAADVGFIACDGPIPEFVGVGTVTAPLDRSHVTQRLKETGSVLVEVSGPLDVRFDNGSKAIQFAAGRYQFPVAVERSEPHLLGAVTKALGLDDRVTVILRQLIDTLRLAGHGALYVFVDDHAKLDKLFPNSIKADWDALSMHASPQPTGIHPWRIVNAYAGFGMMDGAVVLNRKLSLLRYRAYYPLERKRFVEGGGRSRAFARLESDIKRNVGLLAAIKISTDGNLEAITATEVVTLRQRKRKK